MQAQGLDLIEIIHKGAIATYPLILLSIVSVTVVLERLWSLRNINSMTLRITESLLEPIKKGQQDLAIAICKQNSHCPAGRIFLNILDKEGSQRLETANALAVEALFATALGLAVAIIAVIFYNYFQTRIANLNGLFRIQVAKVLRHMSL